MAFRAFLGEEQLFQALGERIEEALEAPDMVEL